MVNYENIIILLETVIFFWDFYLWLVDDVIKRQLQRVSNNCIRIQIIDA